jgi:hypothetical protein
VRCDDTTCAFVAALIGHEEQNSVPHGPPAASIASTVLVYWLATVRRQVLVSTVGLLTRRFTV